METKNFVKRFGNNKIFEWKSLNIFFVVFVLGIFLLNNVSAKSCVGNFDCLSSQICNPTTKQCEDLNCSEPTPVPFNHHCVQCSQNDHCRDDQFCCNDPKICESVLYKCIDLSCANWQKTENHRCVINVSSTESTYPLNITDRCGNKITIYAKPERIVSTVPAVTEILYAIGGHLVGRSAHCDYPPEVLNVPVVAGWRTEINTEKIISLSPDLILFASCNLHQKFYEDFKNLGYTGIILDAKSFDQILENILILGKILNKTKNAEELVNSIIINASIIKERGAQLKHHPKVFYFLLVGYPNIYSTGSNTYANTYIKYAGGKNIFEDIGNNSNIKFEGISNRWFTANKEEVVYRNPDIIILIDPTGSRNFTDIIAMIKNDTVLKNIDAVKRNKFCILDKGYAGPSYRVVEAMEQLYQCFKSWDDEYCESNNDCAENRICNTTTKQCMNVSAIETKKVVQKEYCGDGKCTGNETYENCPQDCKKQEFEPLLIFVIIIIIVLIILIAWKKKKK